MNDSNKTNKTPIFIGVGLCAVALIGWLAFGFFGIQAAFIDNEVSESADNLFDTPSAETANAEVEAEEVEVSSTTPDAEVVEQEAQDTPVEEAEEAEPAEDTPAEEAEAEAEAEEPVGAAVEPATQEIVTVASGSFSGLSDYAVDGAASVLSNGTDQRFLRFENFASDNGPDLKVYLRAADGSFVSLGNLTGNIGDQNYEIPADVDLDVFTTVEIWCERFSVGFGSATLS